MKKLKFSVITVSYNASKTIKETLISVCNQSYQNVEYIIIDGGSTDGTCEIVETYRDKIAYFVSEPDGGIYDAMNKGLTVATGDYVIFLGADDHFVSFTVLEEVANEISNQNDTDAVYYGDVFRPKRNDLYCGIFNKYKLAVKNIPHQALFYPQMAYKNNLYDVKSKVYADYLYNLTLYRHFRFRYLGMTISYFDAASSGKQKDGYFEKLRKDIIVQNLGVITYYYSNIYHSIRSLTK